MGDSRYRRTSGGKNKWMRRRWAPTVKGDRALMKSGDAYEMRPDGWRRKADWVRAEK